MVSKESKKKIIVLSIVIILLIIMLIGGSYAWIKFKFVGEKVNVIKAGKISMKLDTSLSDGINIPNAYPMTDAEGKDQTIMYHFSVENDGNVNNSYQIYLADSEIPEGKTRISDSVIKYRLQKEGEFDKVDYLSNLTKVEGQDNTVMLDSGTLEVGEKQTYIIQVWIDYNADNSVQGQSFGKKLKIEANQIVE